MDLPTLNSRPSRADLAIAFAHAAGTLLTEGRKAVSGGVLGAGGRMMTTADLLSQCADALSNRRRPKGLFRETWYSLLMLRGFLHWHGATLRSYCEALFPIADSVGDEALRSGRPFRVREEVNAMAWSGVVWAVGCSTWESAERAFHSRVQRNLANEGSTGTVSAYDRRRGLLICWTDDIRV